MRHDEFRIGGEFLLGDATYRCTDVGTRTVSAIRVDAVEKATSIGGEVVTETLTREQADADGWFRGPPYAVDEVHFDEDDMVACEPASATPAPAFR